MLYHNENNRSDTTLISGNADMINARAVTLDPLGASLTPGAAQYPKHLLGLAASFRDCLAGTS
jgi:ABC-type Zn2+ transport system substrate-binding protein/surface adhesin